MGTLILDDPGRMAEPCRAAGPSVLSWRGAGILSLTPSAPSPPQTKVPSERLVGEPTAQGVREEVKLCSFGCLNPGVDSFILGSSGDISAMYAAVGQVW